MSSFLRVALEDNNKKHYKQIPTTKDNVDRYKKQYYGLSHIRTGSGYDGVILLDNDIFVAVLQCNLNNSDIQALDVNPKYRKQGIASSLLRTAIRKFNCNKLTVNKSNTAAISLYKKHGYKIIKEEGAMFYMEK